MRVMPFVQRGLMAAVLGLACVGASGQNVSFLEPKDGAMVEGKFKVRLDVKGIKLAPAGSTAAGTGHHHLLVNQDAPAAGKDIPFTKRPIHLNNGQSEVEISLPPGTYKLTAQVGDGSHKSLGPAFSRTITVTVK